MAEFEDKAGTGFQDDWSWSSKAAPWRDPFPAGSRKSQGGIFAFASSDRASLARVVSKAPEVMVKVGRPKRTAKDGTRLYATRKGEGIRSGKFLEYIGRNGKIEIETSDGSVIRDHAGRRELHREWQDLHDDAIEQGLATGRTRLYHSLVLSMPPGTDPEGVKEAARAFAHRSFGGYHDYVLALHTDTDHPHVHIGVRTVGYDGTRLHPSKTDLHSWRVAFAEQLRSRGIEAVATARPDRGIILKPDRQVVRHIRDRLGSATTEQVQKAEVAQELTEHGRVLDRPWDSAITIRRTAVMQSYWSAVDSLRASADPADQALADRTEAYIRTMPAHETRRDRLAAEIVPLMERHGLIEPGDPRPTPPRVKR